MIHDDLGLFKFKGFNEIQGAGLHTNVIAHKCETHNKIHWIQENEIQDIQEIHKIQVDWTIQRMQIQGIHMIQKYSGRFPGFRSDEVWKIQKDSYDSCDSDRQRSGVYWIQGDSGDSNDSGDASPADSLDSRTCKEFKPGGFSGRR